MCIKKVVLFITGIFILNNMFAQLCQGSLGDPVVNIDFGSGADIGPPLSSTVTNYFYLSNQCPNDGYYTIASSINNCFGNTWLAFSEDHTPGDNNGYMMVVNASFTKGVFYVQQVDGLCGGTTYEFAAWMVNIIRPDACNGNSIRPNITFNIETTSGQVLQTYSTGDINPTETPNWKQYGLFFTTPAGVSSVVIRITNNAVGGCGNDLALDDITFRPCGPKVSLFVNGVTGVKEICAGDTSALHFTSVIVGGYHSVSYQWQKSNDGSLWADIPGANSSSYLIPAITAPGRYYFRIEVADGSNILLSSCRIASDFVTVDVNSLPITSASNNGPVCAGTIVTLTATGGTTYAWTGPGNFTSNTQSPVITNVLLSDSGMYHVKVTTQIGCVNIDSNTLIVNPDPVADAGNDVIICQGAAIQLHGSSNDAVSYAWSPDIGLSDPLSLTPFASPSKTTLYTFTVSDGVCKDSAAVRVSVIDQPTANAGPDLAVVGSHGVTLNGQVTGQNLTYFWTPDFYISSDTVLNPLVSPASDTAYVLHVISNDGCGVASDTVLVKYFKDVYVPNAFTPNNDGLNDHWNIPTLTAFPLAEVSVYNRFGQLLFFNKGYTKQWDGTFKGMDQPIGIYVYLIDLKNGLNKLRGTITIIR